MKDNLGKGKGGAVTGGVPGFSFAATGCGIKEPDRLDLALIVSQKEATVAGAFTINSMAAAPVVLCRERVKRNVARALLVNSGCANACTGRRGLKDAKTCASWVADALGIAEEEVLVASTGVIGTYLPMERIREGIDRLTRDMGPRGLDVVARAIMTTDKVPKWTVNECSIEGKTFHVAGVAKGAGMIHPRMATMLCFVLTDLRVSAPLMCELLGDAMEESFHSITVDGDTSTNDTVILMANGTSPAPSPDDSAEALEAFRGKVKEVMREMAMAVVRDAEGATKLIHIHVHGAPDTKAAERIAKCVAHSPLVKTAFYGEEVNWGRIAAAVGYSEVQLEPAMLEIWYDDVPLVRGGISTGMENEQRAQEVARRKEFTVRINVGSGDGSRLIHTCDLSHQYIDINASYKT